MMFLRHDMTKKGKTESKDNLCSDSHPSIHVKKEKKHFLDPPTLLG